MSFNNSEPIAIVGTGCRFPGSANTPSKLWDLLNHPRDLSSDIPLSRFNSDGFYHPDGAHHGTSNVRKSYFLEEDVRRFDSQFFNISTAEAESMDPQQRQLLEVVFEAMESANLTIEQMRGTPTAVYVGLMCDDYSGLIFSDMESVPTYGATGAARSILSNRISYFYDWTGPSYTIDSACSSSLVAVHQAVQQLRNRECSVALAAGANLILSPRMFIAESKLNMLSPNGRCRMWDANGDGYARGEGIAAVMLKRLSDAIADGDHIQCVIRETHVNQGGRSTGLTVPNPVAQVNLIRQAYAKAGLDLNRPEDRPQYFQAHGTGTKVGDLNEATAIHNTFFNSEDDSKQADLYVGSVKTVIGHSEGAAGIAGLLEACLAVQHGVIPPNLHFESLNPKLEPFYNHLEVPMEAKPWPITVGGMRRASVNSFGFGGTNAHVILESHVQEALEIVHLNSVETVALPFVFSAASDRSLGMLLSNYAQFLSTNPDTNLNTLAWTLLARRSTHTHKVSFVAQTGEQLGSKIKIELEKRGNGSSISIASRPLTRPKAILGVFTGQGAQWALMGWDLISTSSSAMKTIESLEQSLASIPSEHRPVWSLKAELAASASTSRVGEAAISQPLCTAIQIILVDHLKEAGIQFSAVVGHSSGEIGAAYAAGVISADAAIKIAHYRGYYAKLAGNGKSGAMLAVGISMKEADELCHSPSFEGRISVAASNSSTSVTLSGDSDAVGEAKSYFEEKSIFARILKVDTAYHSSHMVACSEPYLQALKECDVEVKETSDDTCLWFSSVNRGKVVSATDALKGTYWMENMLQPVLFSQALTQAADTLGAFDFVLEVGPHPALKGPVVQTLQELSPRSKAIPYSGLLNRGRSGVETFAEALGLLWTHFGSSAFDAEAYDKLFHSKSARKLLSNLPTYPWDHERILWYESRGSREVRLRSDPPHQLLGVVASDQAEGQYSWRNYLRLDEITWLAGHKIQGQTIFPAAGYVVMALEAAKAIARDRQVQLIEIQDLKILQAISINDDIAGVETLVGVNNVRWDEKRGRGMGDFTCHACLSKDTGSLVLVCSGRLVIRLGESALDTLPRRSEKQITDLRDVNVDRFYRSLSDVGYGYTGPFRGISSLQQKLDVATGLIEDANFGISNEEYGLMLHPASLDAAIQTLFACLGTPGDGSLWSMHVPVSIGRVRVNPSMCADRSGRAAVRFDARMVDNDAGNRGSLRGNVVLYDSNLEQGAILQMEGIEVKPLMPATPADDRLLFSQLAWGVAEPDATLVYRSSPFSGKERQKAEVLEKICLFYFKKLDDFVKSLTLEESDGISWHGKQILAFARSVVGATKEGTHTSCKMEWLENTLEQLIAESMPYASEPDCRFVHVVGEKLIPFICGETAILEHLMHGGLLNSFYENSELLEYNEYAGKLAAQIAFRYPLIKVLEVGAGTGGVTRTVLRHLDNKYLSYTFTDISVAFFEQAQETFKGNKRMLYEPLDIEHDPTSQGFDASSYDLVIASNVLHATKHLSNTLSNVRKLLKPGGKLLVLEAVDNGAVRVGFGFCVLPGWWAAEDGRLGGPLVTVGKWGELLKENGFSGMDTVTPGAEGAEQPVAVFVSTAVDDEIGLIRNPLGYAGGETRDIGSVILVGGIKYGTQELIQSLKELLEPWSKDIYVVDSLDNFDTGAGITSGSLVHVLNLSELDAPMFRDITPTRLEALKNLLNISRSFVCATEGARQKNPWATMLLGMGRTLVHEMPHVRVQVLDLGDSDIGGREEPIARARLLAEAFLKVVLVEKWNNGTGEGSGGMVWSNEVELWLNGGKWEVTRMRPEKEANNRLMAGRRMVEEVVGLDGEGERDVVDVVVREGEKYGLRKREEYMDTKMEKQDDKVHIRVTQSTVLAMKFGDTGSLHLVVGETVEDKMKVIALSESIGSTISTWACWTLPWEIAGGQEATILAAMSWDIMAKNTIDSAKKNKTLILFEPEPQFAAAILRRARLTSIKPCFMTTKNESPGGEWLHIHPFSSDFELGASLPKYVGLFVDCSTDGDLESGDLAKRMKEMLPRLCKRMDMSDLYSRSSEIDPDTSLHLAGDILRIAAANSLSVLSTKISNPVEVVTVNNLGALDPKDMKLRIIDWKTDPKIQVMVETAENMMRFKHNRTYLLIGLSGNLGRSLCRWMISHGARHIVLTSRNPNIDTTWLDEMRELGGEVCIMAMDVSDKESLKATIKTIEETLPPIAGVANAAMVLNDTLLANMSFTEMQKVLKPKVDGSRYLSELFSSSTPSWPQLDFFILFGSSVDIMGNSGQAAYCSANMFMHGLICERRNKGLVGSLIGLGEVKGVGYAARRETEGGAGLNEIIGATLPLSEREVLAMFAEGVLAGRVDDKNKTGRNPVLYAGIVGKNPRKEPNVAWYPHAKFWQYIETPDSTTLSISASNSSSPTESLKSQLSLATSIVQSHNIVLDAFVAKLKRKLQISSECMVDEGNVLLELGIDSLVAVDLRAWFVVELGVDMPILKILGGASVGDIVSDAVGRLEAAMVPLLVLEDTKGEEGRLVPNGLGGMDVVRSEGMEVTAPQEPTEGQSANLPIVAWDQDIPSLGNIPESEPTSLPDQDFLSASESTPTPGLHEVTTTSDSEGETVVVRLTNHVKKESVSSNSSSEAEPAADIFSGPASPTFSDISCVKEDRTPGDGSEENAKFLELRTSEDIGA